MDSSPGEGDPGPQIIRPIPRRPFNLNFTSPTPPETESEPATPQISANDLRFLDPRWQKQQQQRSDDPDSLSRAASFMNLTSSTLFGIYAPTSPGRDRPSAFDDRDGDLSTATPWGTGAETPAQTTGVDEVTYRLMKDRSAPTRRRPSSFGMPSTVVTSPLSRATVVSSLALRAVLLFALGMGYGVLVTRLPSRQKLAAFGVDDEIVHAGGYDWRYLTLWGVAGVALGSLLPWFDRVWEETLGRKDARHATAGSRTAQPAPPPASTSTSIGAEGLVANKTGASPEADWALVVRGIGAFVGIVFAIRKLPWTSTMQVSLTLALVNPFLWYLIDRSKPGFILSAAVGLVGSAVLTGLSPDVMPAPTGPLSGSAAAMLANTTGPGEMALGGLATQETLETGIWMVSVLFCSCVCFGNIGRRLALNSSAATRGRWGGVR